MSDLEFELGIKGHLVHARLLDYSDSGIRLVCPEGIGGEEALSINIIELGIARQAKTVWSRQFFEGIAIAGLKFSFVKGL